MTTRRALVLDAEAEHYARELSGRFADVAFVAAPTAADAPSALRDVEILISRPRLLPAALLERLHGLRFVQLLLAGTEGLELPVHLRDKVSVASLRGVHSPQMSELAILFMLALAKRLPALLQRQRERHWQKHVSPLLAGKTAVLVGIGGIAESLARKCGCFDMRVIGVSGSRGAVPGFDAIWPRTRLSEAAAAADFLIVLAPGTDANRGLVDREVIGAMKPEAFLINLSRGNVVDEDALVDALVANRIAGAGLDVFAHEPLPSDNALWSLENVILTPHIGGLSDVYVEQALPIIERNLAAYLAA